MFCYHNLFNCAFLIFSLNRRRRGSRSGDSEDDDDDDRSDDDIRTDGKCH